jgi:capsule polysaccharide export protein KpsE/RkpR
MFTARTSFLVPQQQQSMTAAALSSLSALSSLAGAGVRTPGDQYAALLQSTTLRDRLIDQFKLLEAYDVDLREKARRKLDRRVHVTVGKRDGLITVEAEDESPQRAAELANRHIDELRRLTSMLAITEAQQRRVFFEARLKETRDRLAQAQAALEDSGVGAGAVRAEPRAAAEGYARLRAEATAAEVRLQSLRSTLSDNATEVQQQLSSLAALRTQLAKFEASTDDGNRSGYIGKYREYKYQETLFELFSRQYELARLDESKEGALIQVVDAAQPPERKSWPARGLIAIGATVAAFVLLVVFVLARHQWRQAAATPGTADKLARLRAAWRR